MKISVIIPVYNGEKYFKQCLNSILDQSLSAHQILVVNDASTDSSEAIAKTMGVTVLNRVERGGAGAARAEGARAATGEILAFLDSDCVAPKDWLKQIAQMFEQDPDLDGVGGYYNWKSPKTAVGLLCVHEEEYWGKDDSPEGGNSAFRRQIWENHRSGREELLFKGFASGEDTFVWTELEQTSNLKLMPSLQVTHLPPDFQRYIRRHISRGQSGLIQIFNRLPQQSQIKGSVEEFGGRNVVFSSVALVVAIAALIFLFIFPLPAGVILLISLILNFVWFKPFLNSIRHISPLKKIDVFLGMRLQGLLLVRHMCWALGLLWSLGKIIVDKLRLSGRLFASVIHFWIPGRISRLFLFVTAKCNGNCSFCFNKERVAAQKNHSIEELTLREIESIASGLGRMPYLTITGGEPFLRNDLPQTVKLFHRHCKSFWVTITTNGTFPERTAQQTKQILAQCPDVYLTVQVSLDDLHEDHDHSRGLPGAFEQVKRTMESLAKVRKENSHFRLQIATPVNSVDRSHLDKIIKFCRDHFEYDQQALYLIRKRGKQITDSDKELDRFFLAILKENLEEDWKHNKQNLWNRVINAFETIIDENCVNIREDGKFYCTCFAGRKFLTIYEDGQVAPCEVLPSVQFGNLRNFNFNIYKLLKEQHDAMNFYQEYIRKGKCSCDWTCANQINVLYNPKSLLKILFRVLKPGYK